VNASEKGAYIMHSQYGLGAVMESDSEDTPIDTPIDFDLHGMKKFGTALLVVEFAEGTPPTHRQKSRKKPMARPVKAAEAK